MIHNNTLEGLRLCQNPLFLIPISVKPDSVDLRDFKLKLFYQTEFIIYNIYGLRH